MKAQYVSNNMELVKKGKEHQDCVKSCANTTLRAEYDLTEEIYLINRGNTINAKYSWVKGHQDNTKTSDKLSLLAQLNVEADALTGTFQEDGIYSARVPVLPTSSAMLAIRGVSITSHYKHRLQQTYTEARYVEHQQERIK